MATIFTGSRWLESFWKFIFIYLFINKIRYIHVLFVTKVTKTFYFLKNMRNKIANCPDGRWLQGDIQCSWAGASKDSNQWDTSELFVLSRVGPAARGYSAWGLPAISWSTATIVKPIWPPHWYRIIILLVIFIFFYIFYFMYFFDIFKY